MRLIPLLIVLTGCVSTPKHLNTSATGHPFSIPGDMAAATSSMDMLSWIGGLSILGGIAALVITRGAMGVRALLIGVGLVLLNYAVARYADWIFVPVLVATAAISLTYAYRIIRQALLKKKEQSA